MLNSRYCTYTRGMRIMAEGYPLEQNIVFEGFPDRVRFKYNGGIYLEKRPKIKVKQHLINLGLAKKVQDGTY